MSAIDTVGTICCAEACKGTEYTCCCPKCSGEKK